MNKYDPRYDARAAAAAEEQNRVSGFVYIVMLVVLVAFGGLVWNIYDGGGRAPVHIAAPHEPYKIAPTTDAPLAHDAGEDSLALGPPPADAAEPASATPIATPAVATPASTQPRFAANGAFVAQVAALQNEEAVDAAWQRLAARAPDLFAHVRPDIERADLGQRGVYYRVRAGYFATRADAAQFCERVARLGQDCIAVAR